MSDSNHIHDIDPIETQEWVDSLNDVIEFDGKDRAQYLLSVLQGQASKLGIQSEYTTCNTAYCNTIATSQQPEYPGNLELETKLDALIRWNAAVTVAGANKRDSSLGGHIGSFASSCTLYEVGQNHFFKGASTGKPGDLLYIQGHVAPGIYARSLLEGRITEEQMYNFRKEVNGKGLSSYPHPWLMPDYWQFPTVSMGLGPISAIYQARFMKYLVHRGFLEENNRKIWAFCGDGEMDEPESIGAIARAGREKLDNLIFVINCNLQRLDGLVHGNGKIIQEFEAVFKGAGWNVIKVIWGSNWEPLFNKDQNGVLLKYLSKACDGDFQTYQARGGAYMREHFFGQDPELKKLVEDMSDEAIQSLLRGGHDPKKVYAAYHAATSHKGSPTVILAKTVKGFGLGEAGESKNIVHNAKKLKAAELAYIRDRFSVPASDEQVENYERIVPDSSAPEMQYLHERRKALGGYLPERLVNNEQFEIPHYQDFAKRLLAGTPEGREMSTTTAYVQILAALCKDKMIGKRIVPIVPDESRTFGMEGLFRQLGIYNAEGQKYETEDRQQVMYYKEATDGQILQEGINEAGAFGSWVAAATAYSNHQVMMIPFYIYYSMFGFQRIGDMAWMAGDQRARGFLIGGTSGRTTLNGEGLQHEDGHSHVQAGLIPNCKTYDPAFAYELAVIIWHGLVDMYQEHNDVFYYITTMNENYAQPEMPEGAEEGIIKGLYRFKSAPKVAKKGRHVQLLGSGTIMNEVIAAADLLERDHSVAADIWGLTSANELQREAAKAKRFERYHPGEKVSCHLNQCLDNTEGPIIAATDYVKAYTEQLREFMPRRYETLGTDGFGRSDSREELRRHFEVNRYYITVTALKALADDGVLPYEDVVEAMKRYSLAQDKPSPLTV